MNPTGSPLRVEVILDSARIAGYCDQVKLRRRLSEVLNTFDDVLELDDAVATTATGERMEMASVTIEKKSIIAAIPWETSEQDRQRALATSMTGRTQTVQLPVVVFSPPLLIVGTAHLPGGYGTGSVRADPKQFAHFFSVTNARMTLADGSSLEAPIVLVNRDEVSAMARTAESSIPRLPALLGLDRDT